MTVYVNAFWVQMNSTRSDSDEQLKKKKTPVGTETSQCILSSVK
jgi:hypothetical protein